MNRWNQVLMVGLLALPLGAMAQDAPEDPSETTESTEVKSPEEEAAEFRRELRTVEEDVSNLKERVFRSKATLKLLKELVVDTGTGGAQILVWHVNNLPTRYGMESVQYYMDGKTIFDKNDPGGSLDDLRDVQIYQNSIAPGDHELQVNYILRGNGGLFNYLQSYQFRVQSSHRFQVANGQRQMIRVLAESRGGLRNFVDRPTVKYDVKTDTISEE